MYTPSSENKKKLFLRAEFEKVFFLSLSIYLFLESGRPQLSSPPKTFAAYLYNMYIHVPYIYEANFWGGKDP